MSLFLRDSGDKRRLFLQILFLSSLSWPWSQALPTPWALQVSLLTGLQAQRRDRFPGGLTVPPPRERGCKQSAIWGGVPPRGFYRLVISVIAQTLVLHPWGENHVCP